MHSFSPALTAEVERKVATMRLAEPDRIHAAELERALYGTLGELRRLRPRIVEFAPRQAMQRVLHGANERVLLGHSAERSGLALGR